jgi:hypothetical protein
VIADEVQTTGGQMEAPVVAGWAAAAAHAVAGC